MNALIEHAVYSYCVNIKIDSEYQNVMQLAVNWWSYFTSERCTVLTEMQGCGVSEFSPRLRLRFLDPDFKNSDSDSNSRLFKWMTPTPTLTPRFWNTQLRLLLRTFKIDDCDLYRFRSRHCASSKWTTNYQLDNQFKWQQPIAWPK